MTAKGRLGFKDTRTLATVILVVLSTVFLGVPFVSWLLASSESQNPSGPLMAKYFTVDACGGGPCDTTVVTPRNPPQYLCRTSGPNLSGTGFRFPPVGDSIERTTAISTLQVRFTLITATDTKVTLSISSSAGKEKVLDSVQAEAGKQQILQHSVNLENSTGAVVLHAGDLAHVNLVSDSSRMCIDTDSTIWLTLREAAIPPPGDLWSQYVREPLLTLVGASAAGAAGTLITIPFVERKRQRKERSVSANRASASSNRPGYQPE